MHDTPLATHECITIYPPIFNDDDVLQVLDLDEEDHIQHDLVIETESQEILDPHPVPIPNQKPKPIWDQKILEHGGRFPDSKRRNGLSQSEAR